VRKNLSFQYAREEIAEWMHNTPMSKNGKAERFLATVYKIWMMRHVDVPENVSSALMKEMAKARRGSAQQTSRNGAVRGKATRPKYIPVVAIVNGRSARVTLVPAGGGRFRMQINTALRKAAQVDAGDVVSVELRLDLASRSLPIPPDLRDGLKAVPKARKAFEELAPGNRRHFIQWFDSAKSASARQRRLERAIDVLLERALLKPRRARRRDG
jgi:hypothetical protein